MSTILRRFRGPLVALVALIFSAGIAFAGQPASPSAAGLTNAATHAGKTVPVQATDEESEQDEDTETATDETETETDETETETETDSSESSDHCTVDLTQDAETLAGLNHGSVVCTAAQQDPPDGYAPDGFANHGAWVSSFASAKSHGHGADASVHGQGHNPKD